TEALGSSAPTPGGGAAGALVGALGAALAEMVAQLTLGRPKFADVEVRVRDVVERARAARARLLALMDDDARAYEAVSAAYRLPKGIEAERAWRDAAIQGALAAATQPPLRVMEEACDTITLAGEIVAIGNPTVASDAGCAALLGEAAVRVGALNVLANVVLLKDQAAGIAARERIGTLETRAAERRQEVMVAVYARMGLAAGRQA
ncbi:MAG: cyclodeaminase/cyclohydrolase family protein, partial [Ktedonobacterales bacterium]|nr:cyclodeaminase/cyclohydrolase family protein [Ktedonobacterales bacterium]